MVKTLHLTLKKKWFELILKGIKTEEYREIKSYWEKRFREYGGYNLEVGHFDKFVHYDEIVFKNGYAKDAPTMRVECLGINYGNAVAEWSDNWQGSVFVISVGKILETKNLPNELLQYDRPAA